MDIAPAHMDMLWSQRSTPSVKVLIEEVSQSGDGPKYVTYKTPGPFGSHTTLLEHFLDRFELIGEA